MLDFLKKYKDDIITVSYGIASAMFVYTAIRTHIIMNGIERDANKFKQITTNLRALTSSGKTVVFTNAKFIEQAEGKSFRGHYAS